MIVTIKIPRPVVYGMVGLAGVGLVAIAVLQAPDVYRYLVRVEGM